MHKFAISDYKLANLVVDEYFNPKVVDLGDILYLEEEQNDFMF